jgi:Ca-activated chloride channel family protein
MRIFGVDFAAPWFLLAALLAVPAYWWASRGAGRLVFSSFRALPAEGRTWRTRASWIPDAMAALAVAALAVALAGPRRGDKTARVRRDGIAIMMAVDVSGSMRALDLSEKNRELTRLDAVKEVFQRFVHGGQGLDGRDDDAVGLVAFARYADTRCPLTLDHDDLATAARDLDFARPEEDGTAIGAGLELAVTRLAEFRRSDRRVGRVAILLTDGESNVHDIDEDTAIEDAVKNGVKVYTIGAGTTGIAPIRVPQPDGSSELMQMRVSIDETTLRKIADKTGGRYFRATDNASLAKIYKEIDALERTRIEEEQFTEYHLFYGHLVAAAMCLAATSFLLRSTALRRLP